MTIASYSELLDEIDAWLDRSDLTARIPTFIRLFEARMNRRLRVPDMETTVTTTLEADETTYALPDDFLGMKSIFVDSSPDRVLVAMTPANIRATYPYATSGLSGAYAIEAGNIILAPPPGSGDTLTMTYYAEIPALTESNTTNWLLDGHPDAYLYGTLCMAQAYLVDDERLATWKAAWDEAVAEVQDSANRSRIPAGPLTMRSAISE